MKYKCKKCGKIYDYVREPKSCRNCGSDKEWLFPVNGNIDQKEEKGKKKEEA